MSRFLDAMRDSGKQGPGSDKPDRPYKGLIVDVDHVLGADSSRDEATPAETTKQHDDDTGDFQSTSADAVNGAAHNSAAQDGNSRQTDATIPPLSLQEDEPVTVSAAEPDRNPTVSPSPPVAAAVASTGAGDMPVPGEVVSGQRVFNIRSLDPLFYLIVGVAALGLFGSLYALITQNDAYFEREYQQLQRESAALQARLAATAELAARSDITDVEKPLVIASDSSLLVSAVDAEVPVVELQKDEVPEQRESVTASASSEPGGIGSSADLAAPVVAAAPVVLDTEPPDNGMLSGIKQEVDELRKLLTMQEQKIVRLEQDKIALSRQLENHSRHVQTAAPVTTDSDNKPAAIASSGVAGAKVNPIEVTVAQPSPVLSKPPVNPDNDINSMVRRGYLAYQAADYVEAGTLYGEALQFDPYHRDANLGVAAVAQINGDFKLAEHRYRHLLTLDSSDSVAFSALLNLASRGDARSIIEAELSQHVLYVNNPHQLYSIFGNYYSQQQRWLDAEQAYALAIAGDRTNADYLYNYAVALDNLGHADQAADHYSKALGTVSEGDAHSFNITAVEQRLQALAAIK